MTRSAQLDLALAAIDRANAADPARDEGQPAALLYGQRMTAELARLAPGAAAVLQIAARAQHIERWTLPRQDYPEGKAGYLAWRRAQAERHAQRTAALMSEAGFPPHEAERAGVLLRKEGLKRDPEVQLLEDVACLVFLRWYFQPFARDRDPARLLEIVTKTARKMSAEGRTRVLREFDLPPAFQAAFRD